MRTDPFYQALPAIQPFECLTDLTHYRCLPDDWVIGIADIKNSTDAIKQGKYRAVNAVGVAIITAVIHRTNPLAIPFVFGGDGACVCVPAVFSEAMRGALLSVKAMANEQYQFDLRVGIVPVRDIHAAGKKVLVAKYRISEYCTQASFAGGGLCFAEDAVKNEASGYEIHEKGFFEEVDFYGFECRWKEFPSVDGETVAVLVRAVSDADTSQVYSRVLSKIKEIYGDFENCHPLKINKMKMALDFKNLSGELNVRTYKKGLSARLSHWIAMRLQILIGMFCMKWKIKFGEIEWGKYKLQTIKNSDVKKFDDMLRLVIAGSSRKSKQLEDYLEKQRQEGFLFYGLHASQAAIMTCYVVNYASEHYHFVDGSDGGYAMAAAVMKQQIKRMPHSDSNTPM